MNNKKSFYKVGPPQKIFIKCQEKNNIKFSP